MFILMIVVGFWYKQGEQYWRAVSLAALSGWITSTFFFSKTGIVPAMTSNLPYSDLLCGLCALLFGLIVPVYLHRKYFFKSESLVVKGQ